MPVKHTELLGLQGKWNIDCFTVILLLAVPRRLFCFGSLVILDVVCRYLLLFLLYEGVSKSFEPQAFSPFR